MGRKLEVTLKIGSAFAAVVAFGIVSNTPRWNALLGTNIPEFRMPSWPKSVAKPAAIKDAKLGEAFSAESQPGAEQAIWFNPPGGIFHFDGLPPQDSSGVFAIFHRSGEVYIAVVHDGQPENEAGLVDNWMMVAPVQSLNGPLQDMRHYLQQTHFKDNPVLEDVRILPVKFGTPTVVRRSDIGIVDIPELGFSIVATPGQKPETLEAGVGQYVRYTGGLAPLGSDPRAQPIAIRR